MDDGSSNPKKRYIGAYAYGAWTCNTVYKSKTVRLTWTTRAVWISCAVLRLILSKKRMSLKLMLHFLVGPKVLVCWIVVQPPRWDASKMQSSGSPTLMKMIHESPMFDPCGGRSFNFGDGASSKATSWSRLPVRNEALGDFGVPVHLFSDQPKPTPLMLGMDFSKKTPLCCKLR